MQRTTEKAETATKPKNRDYIELPTEHRPVHVVFPSPVRWVPEVHPSSGDRAPEKRSPGTAFCPGWETQFTGGQASEPPAGKNRPYCPWRMFVFRNSVKFFDCVLLPLLVSLSSFFTSSPFPILPSPLFSLLDSISIFLSSFFLLFFLLAVLFFIELFHLETLMLLMNF